MTQAWFVSDIHISDMQDKKARIFLAFLQSLTRDKPCSHLFLVGDIFDLWVGPHQYFQNKFAPIVQEFDVLIQKGVEVHYFEGNHDFHLARFFEDQLNMTVHPEAKSFQLDSNKIRVEHGDLIDPEDKGYLFLRWFLRTPVLRFLTLNLPGGVVRHIGEKASATSREYTSQTKTINANEAIKKLHRHAHQVYESEKFDYLINGHVHLRDDYQSENFRAINLGTWLNEPGAFLLNQQEGQWIPLN